MNPVQNDLRKKRKQEMSMNREATSERFWGCKKIFEQLTADRLRVNIYKSFATGALS